MLKPATLVLVGLASAAAIAHAFRAPFPGPGGNPVLDLIAYHDPGLTPPGAERVKTRTPPRHHQGVRGRGRSHPGRRARCVPADREEPGATATTAKKSRAMPL